MDSAKKHLSYGAMEQPRPSLGCNGGEMLGMSSVEQRAERRGFAGRCYDGESQAAIFNNLCPCGYIQVGYLTIGKHYKHAADWSDPAYNRQRSIRIGRTCGQNPLLQLNHCRMKGGWAPLE